MIVKNRGRIITQIHGHVTVVPKIVCKIFLDDILLVAAADDKVFNAVVAISLHDVPQDRLAPISTIGLGIKLVPASGLDVTIPVCRLRSVHRALLNCALSYSDLKGCYYLLALTQITSPVK